MKLQFEAGTGIYFENVNFLWGKDGDTRIYAEVEVPENETVPEDFGYVAMVEAIRKAAGEVNLDFPYDGMPVDDTDRTRKVYLEIE